MRRYLLLVIFILLVLPQSILAQEQYEKRSFTSKSGIELPYRELSPQKIASGESYPLVIFMHGAGERGSDNELQLFHGSNMFLSPVNREQFPAYVLFPQCPEDRYWAFDKRPANFVSESLPSQVEVSPLIASVMELIDSYISMDSVDKSRVYIVGISMGAMAIYEIVNLYPETFAAAVPICGTIRAANKLDREGIEGIKFRIFHGDKDSVVPVEGSRNAYRALKSSGVDVEYREFVGCDHNSWDSAFNLDDFMCWLFSQKR